MNKLNHIAIIMDGNGRWGLKHNSNRNSGHLAGVKVVKEIVKHAIELNIPILSFYVFSSENWRRPLSEIKFLFKLIVDYFQSDLDNLIKNNIKINILGRNNNMPKKIKRILKNVEKKTNNNKKLIVNLAINYGSRNEILDAIKKIKLKNLQINETSVKKSLYQDHPFPDILIRTGGAKRLSNFMLWQLAYTELFFLDKLWPDFKIADFKKIIKNFFKIKRNFGGI